MMKLLKVLIIIFSLAVLALVFIQFVPYGREHGNPPVVAKP